MALRSGAMMPSLRHYTGTVVGVSGQEDASTASPSHRFLLRRRYLTFNVCFVQYHPNPLVDNPAYRAVRQYFVEEDDVDAKYVVVKSDAPSDGIYFRRAGPRQQLRWMGWDEVAVGRIYFGHKYIPAY